MGGGEAPQVGEAPSLDMACRLGQYAFSVLSPLPPISRESYYPVFSLEFTYIFCSTVYQYLVPTNYLGMLFLGMSEGGSRNLLMDWRRK